MKIAFIRLEDNNRTSLAKMLCLRLSERLPKIKLSEFLYSEWGVVSLTLAYFAAVLDNGQDRFGSSHLAYLSVLSMGNLPHIAVGLLSLLCARVDGFPVR